MNSVISRNYRLMKQILFTIIAALLSMHSYSQTSGNLILSANLDLIKSNNDGYFEKAQTCIEVNYFLFRKFTATSGAEYWTDGDQFSLIIGGRWYPVEEAFIRIRGLIGANDVAIGGGWAKPLSEVWRIEAMGDVYIKGYIAIRAGIAYVIRIRK